MCGKCLSLQHIEGSLLKSSLSYRKILSQNNKGKNKTKTPQAHPRTSIHHQESQVNLGYSFCTVTFNSST